MVPTPIPSSTWSRIRSLLSGSLLDIAWVVAVFGVIGLVITILIAMGPVGYLLTAIVLSALLSKAVREALVDILRRDFAEL